MAFTGLTWTSRRVGSFPRPEPGSDRNRWREGILGSGFFRRFVVQIDQRAKTVSLQNPETFTYSGDGGTNVDLNDDIGWGFGFGYNLSEHLMLGGDFTWLSANYKADIATEAARLGLDTGLSWSCYDPTPEGAPCGLCDSCRLRAKGFAEAGLIDSGLR